MADNEPTISMAGINAPPLYRLVEDGDKTVIMTADTNTPMWVIDGKIGGDTVKTMTTAERTAITPEAGQLIFDTTLGLLFVGDGSTVGGTAVGGGGGGGVVPGYRLSDDGTALNFNPVQPIVNVAGSSVTLVPDTAYKMYATTGAVTINANPPASGYWGLESHIELFVGSTGYVVTGSNVVLANALEPDAVNNCTVRFHDGYAIISVEDHVAGYIVVSATGTTAGTLPYALTSATQEYVAFDASLNGTTIELSGSTANGEKHVVGNGYTETTLTGAVDCGTSKFTVANLSLQGVAVNGGTMTLGDAYIPSGSTVAVSGGGLAIEKAVVDGELYCSGAAIANAGALIDGAGTGTVYPGSSRFVLISGTNASGTVRGVTVKCTAPLEAMRASDRGTLNVVSCTIDNCQVLATRSAALNYSSCTVSGYNGASFWIFNGSFGSITDCQFDEKNNILVAIQSNWTGSASVLDMHGSNALQGTVVISSSIVNIHSGAIIDLTGNTNTSVFSGPGASVIVDGGCTVITSAGASVSIAGGTYTQINNDGSTE